jgi:heat shock protein HtpX
MFHIKSTAADNQRMNANTLKTYVVLAALGGLLVLIGGLMGRGEGALIGLAIGLLFVGASYWFSDKVAVMAARAKPVTEHQAPQIYRIVRELTTAGNMPMPRIYMTSDMQPNAFATGRDENHAVVAVTAGIVQALNEDELRGVLAHELSHVRNKDILLSSVAAAIAMGITFIARMLMWGAMFGGGFGGGRDRQAGNPLGLLALAILAPLAAFLLQMALSRSREYEADRSGANLIGTGEPLARALEKIESRAKQIPMNVDPAHASMYIVNPLTGRRVSFGTLFMTHPPTADRIRRLRGVHTGSVHR